MSFQKQVTIVLLLAVILCFASAANTRANSTPVSEMEKVYLISNDFSTWQGNTGEWQIVGDVFKNPDNEKLLSSKAGKGVIINGPTGRTSHLFSKAEFGDCVAHIEFMVPKESNSGVYFMGRYEIQVLDSWQKESEYAGNECGGIYQRWDDNRTPQGYEGHSPRVNVSKAPGEWQMFDVVFRAPRFDKEGRKISNARFEKVIHNGAMVHEDIELTGPTRASADNDEKARGPLMLQGDHGPVAYRNIWLAPAGPNPFFAMDTSTKDDKHQTANEQVQMLKELGYGGIGIGFAGTEQLAQMLQEVDKNGLRLFAVYLGANIDPNQQKYDPKLKEAMEILKGRNTILWLFVLSQKHKPSSPDGDARAVEIIREIADMAAQYKLRVALYPHHAFWVERVEDAVRVARKVDRKNVGVTFNLCHWLMVDDEKNIQSLIKEAMPYLFVVTINGADSGGKDWKQLIQTLDRGTFNMSGFLKTLKDAGYTGPIGLQGYGIGGDAHENLKRSMDAWRKMSFALEEGYYGPKEINLFDGKSLGQWKITEFGGQGDVYVKDSSIILETGNDLTGVHWTGPLIRMNYEITLEAMRVDGSDFFCGLTFPVGANPCSLILGGWGGTVCGLSNIDYYDAANNETTRVVSFENGKWYYVRLRVTNDKIEAWLDDVKLVDVVTTGRKISIRPEVDASQPLGIASWRTKASIRNIRVRKLAD